jgi:DNA replicative helicase MCM subunit Mcm2 (Cdc46/Mcm family)
MSRRTISVIVITYVPKSPHSFLSPKDQGVDDSTLSQRLRRAVAGYSDMLGAEMDINSGGPVARLLHNEVMRKYIEYAKRYCNPKLTKAAAKVLQRLYLTMRAQSSLGNSIPVTTRHLESLIRLSQARARLELREEVEP